MAAHLSVPGGSAGLWALGALGVTALLALDLGLLRKKARDPSPKEALVWTGVWFGLACVFGLAVTLTMGGARGAEFFTAYFVEQSLSVDNLFVMMIVFASLGIPASSQRKVLVAGILGAAVLRAVLIFVGAAAVARFHVLGYALGALLVVSGVKLLREALRPKSDGPEEAPKVARGAVGLLARVLPVTDRDPEGRFTVVIDGVRHATLLLVALVTIEVADVVFALDSIPAVLGVSSDPFVVLASNVFAILGLRSMYFALAGLLARLRYLKHGLAAVLVIVGLKMLLAAAWTMPTWLSLVLVLGTLVVAAVASFVVSRGTLERNQEHAS
ncbi:MAG: TerC/Alx family metal homeostasis membrane protein [Deltaproteobacteria bacterium]|nr:TerC/Alx family metal homeostasis membrane protein [Deltaproteobacteria bacterium]